jgi:hypothetical protein
VHFCPLIFVGRRDNPKLLPILDDAKRPLGLVFSTRGLFSSSAAADAVADGEAFASDCVCAIRIDGLSQSTAMRLSNSSSLFIDGWKKEESDPASQSRPGDGLQLTPNLFKWLTLALFALGQRASSAPEEH